MKQVGILGFGRFGHTLASLLEPEHEILAYDTRSENSTASLKDVLGCQTLFICVPIRYFEEVILQIAKQLKSRTTVIDVCSVKVHPTKVMQTNLPDHVDIIASHPLFGPDSIQELQNAKIMLHSVRDQFGQYAYWRQFFVEKGLSVLEMSPDEHDRLAAQSQSITHFIGRTLDAAHCQPTAIDTLGYSRLLVVREQTCHDSLELFYDLERFNPYTKDVIDNFLQAANAIKNKMRSKR